MKRSIELCYNNKKVASFFCNPDDSESHYTGYIKCYNDSEIIISHIATNGLYDGYILRHIEDIYRIDYDGSYEKRIEKIYQLKGQTHNAVYDNGALFFSAIKYAKENSLLITIQFKNSRITGVIQKYDDECISLIVVDDDGAMDGISTIRIDEILFLDLDTEYEQNLKILLH